MANTQTVVDQVVEVTQDGLAELQAELAQLRDEKLPKIVERVAAARDQGDLSENADYQNARDEQEMMQTRIDEIEAILTKVKVVKNTTSNAKVGMGSTVELSLVGKASKSLKLTVVDEFQSDPDNGKISNVSPLGKALIGKKKGDTVAVVAPAGEIQYTIAEIK